MNAARLLNYFGPLEVMAALLAITAAIATRRLEHDAAPIMLAVAMLSLATLLPFFVYFSEANASFADASVPLTDLPQELLRWERWHWARTLIAVVAFLCAVVAPIESRDKS